MHLTAHQQAIAAAGCEVRFDRLTRRLFATDASIYQIEPLGVAFPRTTAQAAAVLRAAADAGVPVTPRGAGSGLVGGALGDGLVVDFARHNRQISALDLERRTVRVGAGVILDQLNDFLKPHGLGFGPDVATSSRATLGGMIANNSCGAHSVLYGRTCDHVLRVDVVLWDGTLCTWGKPSPPPAARAQQCDAALAGIARDYAADIAARFPKVLRSNGGYALDRLRVTAAVGVGADSVARAEALVRAGVDALVVDTAHGHTRNVIEALRRYRASYGDSIDLVAGNVATPEGTAALIEAGADGVKVGIGPGSICTTRIVAGVGVPQLTAIMMCAAAAHAHDVPIIGDGGIRYSGDIVKALAAGADSVMLGRLLAVAEESPGEAERVGGRVVKEYRAMGSLGAMQAGSDRYPQIDRRKLVPEGVEAIVAVAGPLSGIIYQLIGGTKAGMTYCGADSIADLRVKARFVQLTHSGQIESHPHDIDLARSAPNYP